MSAEPVMSTSDVETFVLGTCSGRSRSLSGPAPASQEIPFLDFKLLIDPPLPSANITDLINEPLFCSGYSSEEEEEEDMSSDAMSFSSSSAADESFDDFDTNFPELLAEDCTFVEQQCNRAEAVKYVSPGKPKMVQVTKADVASTPVPKRPSSSSSRQSRPRSSSRLSILSFRAHSHDGTPNTPPTPSLELGSETPTSCSGPATPETPGSDFFTCSDTNSMTPTPKPRNRNPYRLRLPLLGKRSVSDIRVRSFESPLSAPITAPPVYQPKLLARAAGDRAPTAELPSCPPEQVPQPPKSARPWMLRKDSFGPLYSKDQKQRLRRAESGSLPVWR